MSTALVRQFLRDLDRTKKVSGSLNEQTIRPAFRDMLKRWAGQEGLFLLEEYEVDTGAGTRVRPDGTIVHYLRLPLGYWESKDTKDDLDAAISAKIAKGYPVSNIIFENAERAVLYQHGNEAGRADMRDVEALAGLLTRFFKYERPEIADFRRAVEQFKTDLPMVLDALRERIETAYADNADFKKDADDFLAHAKKTVNPAIGEADIREMLIQHILTEEIFNHVFNEGDFHRENNIAKKLYELERRFFSGAVKRDTMRALDPYYNAIRGAAAAIAGHGEKQKFLKAIYEDFYKVYNPKAADRLGVVYTPNEIVRFMIDGADWLCRQHFGRGLIDEQVNILDPCTGTGTFICEILEHFRGEPEKLARKYEEELFANEVAILPYYVANLNIEATWAAITGGYAEYRNLCFVDTLDNVAALDVRKKHQYEMLGAVSDENIKRVKRQNKKTISVIIGNPPYNANQQNENDNNKNRAYKAVDDVIKRTWVARSTAQKTKVYDMYARFWRWAADRLGDEGIIAFITNRSFIDSRTFDGFRADMADLFSDIHVIDLGGDVRANPKLSGTTHNVFGIQTGVAIAFMVKHKSRKKAKGPAIIRYARRPEMETAADKLSFLAGNALSSMTTDSIKPSDRHDWINQIENEWNHLLPVADKDTRATKQTGQEEAIFKLFSLGVVTNRDEWMIDWDKSALKERVDFFVNEFNKTQKKWRNTDQNRIRGVTKKDKLRNFVPRSIKWTEELENHLDRNTRLDASPDLAVISLYRPFVQKFIHYAPILVHRTYQQPQIFPIGKPFNNQVICFTVGGRLDFSSFATAIVPNLTVLSLDANQCLPRYRYTSEGERIDNITAWALRKFQARYGKGVSGDDIFHYCYAVLHDPVYRETYAINLKREFPRIPLYPDFAQWAAWGRQLMDLHINYEDAEPWPLARVDTPEKRADGSAPKAMLRSDPDNGSIRLDADTQLTGVPPAAWRYRLGNRSAIDWVLDQHREKKPRDPTIREKFNTYRFADYKEKVIDLLGRVTRVSVETVAITDAMQALNREEWDTDGESGCKS